MTNELYDREGNLWPTAYTRDGVLIVPGLPVTDYDRRATVVSDRKPYSDGAWGHSVVPWFYTENGGMFDGSRLEYRKVSEHEVGSESKWQTLLD